MEGLKSNKVADGTKNMPLVVSYYVNTALIRCKINKTQNVCSYVHTLLFNNIILLTAYLPTLKLFLRK